MTKDEWYNKAIRELETKYQNAKPQDLSDFDGLMDVKGYCEKCNRKEVLIYDRHKKQSLCLGCSNSDEQYFPHEMASMWDVAQQLLYYFKELGKEMDKLKKDV